MSFIRNTTHYLLAQFYLLVWRKTDDFEIRMGLMQAAMRHSRAIH
jgi:hypothetical protein